MIQLDATWMSHEVNIIRVHNPNHSYFARYVLEERLREVRSVTVYDTLDDQLGMVRLKRTISLVDAVHFDAC
jgi:hypothetical protein